MNVLLLHAGIADRRMWAPQVEALGAEGHRVVAPDLPGFGDQPLEPGIVDYVAFAADRLDGPGAVVGCSFGGRVALELAAARPDLVERLVLIGAAFGSWDWSEAAQAVFAEEEESIERGELAAAAAQQARIWLADDATPDVRELTEAMTLRSYEQQLPMDGQVKAVWPDVSAETRLAELGIPRSSSSARRMSTTSRRWPRGSSPGFPARDWRRSRAQAISRPSSGRTSSTGCCWLSWTDSEGLAKYWLGRRAALPRPDAASSVAAISAAIGAPCVLASERASHPDDERHSARPS